MNVEFNQSDHSNPTECQLLVALTGSSKYIAEQLRKMIREIESSYGKPVQGQSLSGDKNYSHIITKIWEGKKY